MKELGMAEAGEYRAFLEIQDDEWKTLDACCRVTISRFFRDREVFRTLQGMVLPELAERVGADGRSELRCWSAGCGSGEEAYTLSLLWRLASEQEQAVPLCRVHPQLGMSVTATDADPKVLDRARAAVYPPGALKDLPATWMPAAFEEVEGGFSLRPGFREDAHFLLLDIRGAPPEGTFDLILCRNLVFTYFEERLQRETLASLLHRLREGGVLVIGGHEKLPEGRRPLTRMERSLPVYRKEEPARQA
jgi:chemotaxis protein methyltransferase CheR